MQRGRGLLFRPGRFIAPGPSWLGYALCLICLSSLAAAQTQAKPYRERCTWTALNYINGSWQESVLAKTVDDEYDAQARLSRSITRLGSGLVAEEWAYEYGPKGLSRVTVLDGSGQTIRVLDYAYQGTERRLIARAPDGRTLYTERQTLDAYGFLVSSECSDALGAYAYTRRFAYDAYGRLSSLWVQDASGVLIYEIMHSYTGTGADWTMRRDFEHYYCVDYDRPRYVLRRSRVEGDL